MTTPNIPSYELGQVFASIAAKNVANGGVTGLEVGVTQNYGGRWTPSYITWEVLQSGTSSTISAKLQGSLDDTNWYDLDQTTLVAASQARSVVFKPFRYYRVVQDVATGAAGTITGNIYII